ncbi:MAG: serine/threonine-protein kinase, partial [Cyanobacteria bacterium J06576_12]
MPTPLSAQSNVGLIGGRYQMERRLAAGGFGQTFVARDLHLPGQPACVIKQLKPRFSDPSLLQTALRLFDREASALYDLGEHAQIPRLLAHFEEEQQFYLAQELIEGAPLSDLVMVGQPWEEMAAIALLQDILQVLSFVHQQGAIHRDIKPDNLLWRDRDERIVMIDFGAVKLVEQQISSLSQPHAKNKLSSLTVAIGTPGYMPIEQLSGKPRFSSDIYSTGMVVIQAVTGLSTGQLFPDDDTGEIEWRSHAPHISDRFAKVLTKMIRYDFRQRYTDASDALEAVHKLPQRTLSAVKRSGYLPAVSSQDAEESKPTPPKLPPTQPPTGPRVSIRERLLSFGSAGKALLPVMPSATTILAV